MPKQRSSLASATSPARKPLAVMQFGISTKKHKTMKSTMFIFLFLANLGFAQSVQNSGLNAAEFESAKKLYIKMMESEDYKKKEQLNDELRPILKESSAYGDFLKVKPTSEDQILDWIKNNVAKEKVEKATGLFREVIKLESKVLLENKEVFELISRATKDQRMEILKPIFEKEKAKYGF